MNTTKLPVLTLADLKDLQVHFKSDIKKLTKEIAVEKKKKPMNSSYLRSLKNWLHADEQSLKLAINTEEDLRLRKARKS